MPQFKVTIRRTVAFDVTIEGQDQSDALRKLTTRTLAYDDRDHERTEILNIRQLPDHGVCDLSDGT